MEKINIEGLKEINTAKGTMLALKFNGGRDATIAAWDKEQVTFVNSLGVGGSFEADVLVKGQYTNIENVNMKTGTPSLGAPVEKVPSETKGLPNLRDERILAAVLLKGAVEMSRGHDFANLQDESQYMAECIAELNSLYKVALDIQC